MYVDFIVMCVEEETTVISKIEDCTGDQSRIQVVDCAGDDFFGRWMHSKVGLNYNDSNHVKSYLCS